MTKIMKVRKITYFKTKLAKIRFQIPKARDAVQKKRADAPGKSKRPKGPESRGTGE